MKKIMIVLIVVSLLSALFFFDVTEYLTLNGFKNSQYQLILWQKQNPLVFAFSFFFLYVLATALSIPGAAIFTLAAGALFGVWKGILLVSFASSIGATLAFMMSRYVLRDTVQQHFGKKLNTLNAGIKKDGALYLFGLRLVPLFPFFVVNLLMGLTSIRVLTFYWVSQIGMLAGTIVYVNAGTQISKINGLNDILSVKLFISFLILAIFPFLASGILRKLQHNKIYARWKKPKSFDRNLIVIGAGAAGLVTSYIAAAVKAKVTLVEAHKMGGDCLNYGCVPSKALIKSAKLVSQMAHAERYGLNSSTNNFSFQSVMTRIQTVIAQIEPHDSIERYTKLGVEVLSGYAKILDPWTVEIKLNNGEVQRLTTRSIVIATGAQPFIPALLGIENTGYVSSDTLWKKFAQFDHAPKQLVVLGGGPIGCELAQSFARLGSRVTQIEMSDRIMNREDSEVSQFAQKTLIADGVQVLTQHTALRCEINNNKKYIVVKNKDRELLIEFDELICAVGRAARLTGFGLEELGISAHRAIPVNEYLETIYPNIYCAGDVAGPYQLTHVAAHQAWYAAVNALFGKYKRFKVDYSIIPWTTFLDPEIARVGLNEQEACEKNIAYEITRYGIDDLDRAITDGVNYGFIKVLTVPDKDTILGVTIVGEHAGELLSEFVLAMKYKLGLNKILGTIHTYPTFSEANKYTAGEWRRAHAPKKILQWAERFHNWKRR
ncbi:MAG: FAD-dependent oxidoreductase [Pseudomonadota bacterium]